LLEPISANVKNPPLERSLRVYSALAWRKTGVIMAEPGVE
jgi:hypothetical protein